MTPLPYVDGYVIAVPVANREAYLASARTAAQVFRENGAIAVVETWGDDVPTGKVTDFHRAVALEAGEAVVFSWVTWPSKTMRDAGMAAMMTDERMKASEMPFDGKRMIFGGFQTILDTANEAGG